MKAVAILACLALAACGTVSNAPPIIKTVTVNVPVAISCVPADALPGAVPILSDADLKAMPDAAARYQALADFRAVITPLIVRDEALLANCRAAAK